ncbi:MAG: hypothetical protein E7Z98_06440 [Olsenella sp.]|nr:hypothetical protein [Olsenella sp.]
MHTHHTTYLVPLRAVIAAPLSAALVTTLAAAPATMALLPTVALAEPQVQTQDDATPDKAETVYVYADASGATRSVEVEARLANRSGASTLFDESDLTDITATSGGAAFSTGSGGELVWTSDGGEVSYEGTSAKEPPLEVRVSYQLDGRDVSPQELLGASGHVTIRYDYLNNAEVDGTKVPFLAITGVSLDPARFSNMSVTNGRIMDEAGSLVVVGYALPGLQEGLVTELEDLEMPDHFEIQADVTDFELDKTLTLVTPDLLSELDTGGIDFGELDEAMDAMRDAVGALGEGAGQLSSGLDKLAQGAGTLDSGAAQYDEMLSQMGDASALTDGAAQLTGLVGQLQAGATQASQGASALAEALGKIKDDTSGAAGVAGGLAATIDAAGDQVGSAKDRLTQLGSSIESGKDTALQEIDGARAAANPDQIAAAAQAAEGAAAELSGATQAALAALDGIDTTDLEPEQAAAIDAAVEDARKALTTPDVSDATGKLSAAAESLGGVSGSLAAARTAIEDIPADTSAIADGLDQTGGTLDSASGGARTLEQNLSGAAEGIGSAAKSASDLGNGMEQLADGVSAHRSDVAGLASALGTLGQSLPQAAAGAAALHQGASALAQGTAAAADGASQLADGIGEFDEQGVSKLADELDAHIGSLPDRIDALSGAARDYTTFSGLADGQTGSVRFIYEVDAIKAEE